MKKLLFILLFALFVASSLQVNAQIIKTEAIVGLNLTQVEGDEVAGFKKPGLNVGAGVLIPFGKKWDLSFEVTYNQKGANEGVQYHDTVNNIPTTGAYKLRLNYAEIPVLIHFTDKDLLTIGAGFAYGQLVGVQEWEHGRKVESTSLNSNTYNRSDFSYLIDVRIKIKGPLKFSFRYQNSLAKIRTREFINNSTGAIWTRDQYNKVLTFRLIYVFNESKSKQLRQNSGGQ
ncbi:MAG: outer membrane beta-barrel protein [Bacteroidales bacterium]|nr:outer membrane beta-barrel protein [Bacteroidales bacterium]